MSVEIFKGIRFATVAARFEPPVDADGAADLDAVYGPQCPQIPGMIEQMLGQGRLPSAEDCQFLNVFTPACDGARRPVLVWVHGGAFVNGTGAMPWYHGASLARRYDVVVVTLNYRLGALGFLHLDGLADSGNLGLLDQLSALRWVQRNISTFGGDPDDVTIFGESAGGASVVTLLAAPAGSGLFHRAVALSPSITQLRTRPRAAEVASTMLATAGLDVEGLRNAPVEVVLDAQRAVLTDRVGAFTAFAPTPGDAALPLPVTVAAARNPVPLVIGSTKDEMLLFHLADRRVQQMDDAALERAASERFGEAAPAALAAYRVARPGASPGALFSAIATDETFRVPARQLAAARADAGHRTWMHWFTWQTPSFGGLSGSCHALDVPFVFHNLDRNGVEAFTGDSAEREEVATFFSGAVAAFARSGSPGWDQYETGSRATMRIDVSSVQVDDPESELREIWDSLG